MLNLAEVQLRIIGARNTLRILREDVKPIDEKIQFWEAELQRLRDWEVELQEKIEAEESETEEET
jgi:hypothetical protein